MGGRGPATPREFCRDGRLIWVGGIMLLAAAGEAVRGRHGAGRKMAGVDVLRVDPSLLKQLIDLCLNASSPSRDCEKPLNNDHFKPAAWNIS
jgi:hypothetical protein